MVIERLLLHEYHRLPTQILATRDELPLLDFLRVALVTAPARELG
jgi:hypothetical protein